MSKKIKFPPKPRSLALKFDMGQEVEAQMVKSRVDKNGIQWIRFLKDGQPIKPVSVEWEIDTPRGNPQKPRQIISRIPFIDSGQTDWPLGELPALAQFDVIVTLDTNSSKPGGSGRSVTAIFSSFPQVGFGRIDNLEPALWFSIVPDNAEKRAWIRAVEWIEERQAQINTNGKKIGILTDHDLGAHQAINNREIPILGEFYLPENIWLLYATSNAATTERLANNLIDIAEKKAGQVLKNYALWPDEWKSPPTKTSQKEPFQLG